MWVAQAVTMNLLLESRPITDVFIKCCFNKSVPFFANRIPCKRVRRHQLMLKLSFFQMNTIFKSSWKIVDQLFFSVTMEYCIFRSFVLFPDEVHIFQEVIYFTGSKKIQKYLFRLVIHDPWFLNGYQILMCSSIVWMQINHFDNGVVYLKVVVFVDIFLSL